ncbi:zinc finger HIT domain-containing protein 3 isoform X2 [Malaclemys terrapin pileata]|uniref:zinc finger HIT domain-containing protein 3 isoform X2 n=1 Tax=Malaclemys terrapin pileata TaxID=2991368 RepID=UPI0023A8E3EA|nr:zinc finger HIT domain-containing protein 3 isoform X2 [Malaclemys terrapin pileata]XP_053864276.1 zinc finger HIT domain-containing protein 3 isoform X2 [Malaclemys terrapin pileata]XP_053864277.1 zinc finger HIT domain-containing protein 3 isoform X2 [Malaclemys terrapin pileata]XP_053864278.1 zinc finger HIT domain-containing protein 3 isoform X2 [Malaclemys terrapin pileata]
MLQLKAHPFCANGATQRSQICSVPCYKKHKEQCIAKPDQVVKTPITDTSSLFRRVKPGQGEGSHWSVDDILTEDDEVDRVPLQKLKLLGESKELRNLLLNPHLQQLLLTVDQAKEKDSLMKTYMQEPLFVEFADCCLRVVEPPEKENCLLD